MAAAARDPLDDALDSTFGGKPPSPAQHDILDAAVDFALTPPPKATPAKAGPQADPWGYDEETGNGLLLGGGVAARSASEAITRAFKLKFSNPNFANVPFLDILKSSYDARHMANTHAREAYLRDSPGSSLLAGVGGGTIPTAIASALGQEYAVAPMARRITQALPDAKPLVNFLTGTLPQEAGALTRFGSRMFTGGTMGALTGGMQSEMSDKPVGEQIEQGAALGSVLNPLLGTAADQFASKIAPRVAEQARTLMDRGIPLNAGQILGASWLLKLMHNNLGDASGAPQRTALTRALSRTFGEDSPTIDNTLMTGAEDRIGGLFKKFEGATIQKDQPLQDSIVDVLANAHGDLHTGTGIPEEKLTALREAAGLIGNTGTKGEMTGAHYLALTKRGSTLDRLQRDPDVGYHAAELRDALDEALARSVASAGGRWVPATAAGANATTVPVANRLLSSAGGARAQPLLAAGGAGDLRPPVFSSSTAVAPQERRGTFAQPEQVQGTLDPMGKPGPPGMVWEIDPATQGALQTLHDARGQYKNLVLARGIMNDASGEIQPKALASRIAKFYPPRKFNKTLSEWERAATDLGPISQFVPNGPGGTKPPSLMSKLAHGSGLTAGAVTLGELLHNFGEANTLLGMAGTAGAYGLGRLATRVADSPTAAARMLENAGRAPRYGAEFTPNLLLTPGAVQLYNKKKGKSNGH